MSGSGPLNQEEVNDVSIKIENLANSDETTARDVVVWVLRALPDSEWGQGNYDLERLPDHYTTDTDQS